MILLDMEIPKSCWDCPMQRYTVSSNDYRCVITGKFAGKTEGRSAFCPIKEIRMRFPTYEEMAKDVAQKAMDDFLFNGKSIREWAKLIIALGIPENPTNGDVIEALFPWIKSEKDYENSMVAILVRGHKGYIHFDMEWWNAPWKGQENAE